jgi:alkanesulfonate monooxygenase SsuD/methylene tetrahydromethanopterin reductase-like flavin-dependent oxidoreductase (luciferase family)
VKFGSVHIFESPEGLGDERAVREQLELVELADRLGFDSAWIAEHHFSDYGVCGSPAIVMAAAAVRTSRIRLASSVSVLPLHHPVRVAEEFALLDHLSGGRVDLGVGRGYQAFEFRGYGVEQSEARERTRESVEIIRRLWSEEHVTHHGRFWDIEDVTLRPRPLQRPHPPMWMACLSPESFEPCGFDGYHLLCAPVFGFDAAEGAAQVGDWRAGLRRARIDPSSREVGALAITYVAESRAEAERDLRDAVLWYYRALAARIGPKEGEAPVEGYEGYGEARGFLEHVSWETALERSAVVCGSPSEVAEQIRALRRSCSITTWLAWTRIGGLDTAKVSRSMELLQTKVRPLLD